MKKSLILLVATAIFTAGSAFARDDSGYYNQSGYSSNSSSYNNGNNSSYGGMPNNNSHAVSGYTRSNGTYVAPHHATNPDSSRPNNWSHQGNTNPYTGQAGTKRD